MKRNPRMVKWTKAYRRLHGNDMTQDSTLEFERKRNRSERYDRNLYQIIPKAIKTIDKSRTSRAESYITKRLKRNKQKEHEQARAELEQGIDLVKAPSIQQQRPISDFAKDQSQDFTATFGRKLRYGRVTSMVPTDMAIAEIAV